ncbi:MAG: hypothetical protein HZB35_01865 [Nitrospirae bacterium]|nr:hypothetical protein [Nitrospirota bacterium]
MRLVGLAVCVTVMLVGISTAWAYEEVPVTEGGTVAGRIRIVGGKPVPKGFNLITLVAWHPGVGVMMEKKITVAAKQTLQADFAFDSPRGRRSVHEIEDNPHFGLGSLGKSVNIRPSLELQTP